MALALLAIPAVGSFYYLYRIWSTTAFTITENNIAELDKFLEQNKTSGRKPDNFSVFSPETLRTRINTFVSNKNLTEEQKVELLARLEAVLEKHSQTEFL